MKIILSSKNQAKVNAVNNFFNKILWKWNFELKTYEVKSGVSKTPTNDNEWIQWAINRINELKKIDRNWDLYLWLEWIIQKNNFWTFVYWWTVIESKNNIWYWASWQVKIPENIAEKIENFKELATLVKENYDSELINEMPKIWANWVITKKIYSRDKEFEDALSCAYWYISNNKK